jgi:hypothetical protein
MNEKNEFPPVVSTKQPERTSRELVLPRSVLIIESLANSFYKITLAIILAFLTYQLATGDISTDAYVKLLIQLLLENSQNLVIG